MARLDDAKAESDFGTERQLQIDTTERNMEDTEQDVLDAENLNQRVSIQIH